MPRSDPPLLEDLSLADFLCLKGPWGLSFVLPGESEAKFLEHVGLNEAYSPHKRVFRTMKAEAIRARDGLFNDPAALVWDDTKPDDRACPTPPCKIEEIRENAFAQAIIDIYDSASVSTQNMYALVGAKKDNWIIRWLLHHVIDEAHQKTDLVADQRPLQRLLDAHSPPLTTDLSHTPPAYTSAGPCPKEPLSSRIDFHALPSPISDNTSTMLLDQETRPASRSSRGSYWDPIREG